MILRYAFVATFIAFEQKPDGWYATIKIGNTVSSHFVGEGEMQLAFKPGVMTVAFEQHMPDPPTAEATAPVPPSSPSDAEGAKVDLTAVNS